MKGFLDLMANANQANTKSTNRTDAAVDFDMLRKEPTVQVNIPEEAKRLSERQDQITFDK